MMAYPFLLIVILLCLYGLTQSVPGFLPMLAVSTTGSLIAVAFTHYVWEYSPNVY